MVAPFAERSFFRTMSVLVGAADFGFGVDAGATRSVCMVSHCALAHCRVGIWVVVSIVVLQFPVQAIPAPVLTGARVGGQDVFVAFVGLTTGGAFHAHQCVLWC